ncbi:MAG: hypothetical protein ACLP52_00455 [Streptosporangiaceae bacterium]
MRITVQRMARQLRRDMRSCASCGRQALPAARFCTDCGLPLAGEVPGAAVADADPFGYLYAPQSAQQHWPQPEAGWQGSQPEAGWQHWPQPGSASQPESPWRDRARPGSGGRAAAAAQRARHRLRWPVALAVALVLAVAAGVAAVLHEHGLQRAASAASGQQLAAATPGRRQIAHRGPAARRVLVKITSRAAGQPGARRVARFAGRYFATINHHDYAAYRRLLTLALRDRLTPQAFAAGYATTRDSRAVLHSLSAAPGGALAAAVTFTSHQRPADSPAHAACTAWRIVLFLERSGRSYRIGPPPASYHATYRACA